MLSLNHRTRARIVIDLNLRGAYSYQESYRQGKAEGQITDMRALIF